MIAGARAMRPRRSIQFDERVQCQGQEEGDHHPREDVARDPQHLERDGDPQDDEDHPQDRSGAQVDHTLGRHRVRIPGRSDVGTVRTVSLRSAPVIEHAALPGGGTVTVWVGIVDDPYINDKSALKTVDVQLHEGGAVIASVSTVLEPGQSREALALARDVKAALEAGRIGLHAHELEPFADQLR